MNRAAVVTGSSRGSGRSSPGTWRAKAGLSLSTTSPAPTAPSRWLPRSEPRAGGRRPIQPTSPRRADVRQLIDRAGDDLGPVLAVVANATGPQPPIAVEELTWQAHLDQLMFFVKSPTLLVQAALPAMKKHRHGSGDHDRLGHGGSGQALWSAYSAAKAAQVGSDQGVGPRLGPYGITVNLVAPGFIPVERHAGADTEAYRSEVPLGRMGTPDDIAGLVGYLASDAGRIRHRATDHGQRRPHPRLSRLRRKR